jgi:2-isopropylmalate synthase
MHDQVKIFDTTLRDGTQSEDVSLLVEDKLTITEILDDLGVHYIEGGWPGSNPKDEDYFRQAKSLHLKNAKISSFGSTRRAKLKVEEDPNIIQLVESQTPVITIFGKSWDLHVKDALKITLDENLEIIYDSVQYLKKNCDEFIYDAEHFFDGFKNNPEYALKTLQAAIEGGADVIVLADTNGGTLPWELEDIIEKVKSRFPNAVLGIHQHNDSELGVANTILAVKHGIVHVQGTINGYGERCGNANLCSIIPNLKLKMGIDCISDENLKKLTMVSKKVDEILNLHHNKHLPFVGESAFAHKGGVHVSAILKNSKTYEHIVPELVGNSQRVLVSDLSGISNIMYKAQNMGIPIDKDSKAGKNALAEIKKLENEGYYFETADASFELLLRKHRGEIRDYFEVLSYTVIDRERCDKDQRSPVEATAIVKVKDKIEHTASLGNGPVNALDNAIRKALIVFYPNLAELALIDYKVRILKSEQGTGASVRVLIQSTDKKDRWETVGVGEDVIEASKKALFDSIIYKLMKDDGLVSKR